MQSVQYVSDGLVYGYKQWSWVSRSIDPSKFGMFFEDRGFWSDEGSTSPNPFLDMYQQMDICDHFD